MKKINWLDHITNLLVVILGISIAFYLEGYRAEKDNQAQERRYLESLVTDLNADIEALDTLIQVNDMIIKATNSLSSATNESGYDDHSKLRNDVLMIQYNPPLVPQGTIYESMKASGKMDLVNDFELRNKLVELYEQYYRGTSQYDEALDQHLRDFIKPFFIKSIRYTSGTTVEGDFLQSPEFQNIIFSYRYLFEAKNDFYREVRKQVEEVKELVKARLTLLSY